MLLHDIAGREFTRQRNLARTTLHRLNDPFHSGLASIRRYSKPDPSLKTTLEQLTSDYPINMPISTSKIPLLLFRLQVYDLPRICSKRLHDYRGHKLFLDRMGRSHHGLPSRCVTWFVC